MPDADVIALCYGQDPALRRWRRTRRAAKWAGLSAAVLIIVAVVAHTAWLLIGSWRLNCAIATLVAAGEPLNAAAIAPPVVPASQNGYDELAAAAAVMAVRTPAQDRSERLDDPRPPLMPIEHTRLSAWQDGFASEWTKMVGIRAMARRHRPAALSGRP